MEQMLFEHVYNSVVRREPTYDGIYYTGVLTTRIVCRPSCRARTPKASNVIFYTSLEEALQAGFRPCKRCRPEEGGALRPDALLAAQTDELLETGLGEKLTLRTLAEQLKVSPFHLQRTYKQVRGLSPAARLEELRLERARQMLEGTRVPVAEIARQTGVSGPSHFTSWFARKTGMTPTEYRDEQQGRDPL
ncbi:bifunctional transcriptional activator/DNA repair enzyme AdaA [Paenibacillus tengchongensis]|uniref:bifunctional transcriptional activator/DNA repair enzyme AdaA n=1 Tax=Paenibacillus tengchongensis TaxID=2608684 RepID=UPI00124F2579|nr:Ada metal-binding domain-containing protein [Paenibacillus tengchongensis]